MSLPLNEVLICASLQYLLQIQRATQLPGRCSKEQQGCQLRCFDLGIPHVIEGLVFSKWEIILGLGLVPISLHIMWVKYLKGQCSFTLGISKAIISKIISKRKEHLGNMIVQSLIKCLSNKLFQLTWTSLCFNKEDSQCQWLPAYTSLVTLCIFMQIRLSLSEHKMSVITVGWGWLWAIYSLKAPARKSQTTPYGINSCPVSTVGRWSWSQGRAEHSSKYKR